MQVFFSLTFALILASRRETGSYLLQLGLHLLGYSSHTFITRLFCLFSIPSSFKPLIFTCLPLLLLLLNLLQESTSSVAEVQVFLGILKKFWRQDGERNCAVNGSIVHLHGVHLPNNSK